MQLINTKGSSVNTDLETRNTLANAHALARSSVEKLIGSDLGRSEKVDLDSYLAAALGQELKKA